LRGPAAQERELEHLIEPYAQQHIVVAASMLLSRVAGMLVLRPVVVPAAA